VREKISRVTFEQKLAHPIGTRLRKRVAEWVDAFLDQVCTATLLATGILQCTTTYISLSIYEASIDLFALGHMNTAKAEVCLMQLCITRLCHSFT
jgi:hypothetical protein